MGTLPHPHAHMRAGAQKAAHRVHADAQLHVPAGGGHGHRARRAQHLHRKRMDSAGRVQVIIVCLVLSRPYRVGATGLALQQPARAHVAVCAQAGQRVVHVSCIRACAELVRVCVCVHVRVCSFAPPNTHSGHICSPSAVEQAAHAARCCTAHTSAGWRANPCFHSPPMVSTLYTPNFSTASTSASKRVKRLRRRGARARPQRGAHREPQSARATHVGHSTMARKARQAGLGSHTHSGHAHTHTPTTHPRTHPHTHTHTHTAGNAWWAAWWCTQPAWVDTQRHVLLGWALKDMCCLGGHSKTCAAWVDTVRHVLLGWAPRGTGGSGSVLWCTRTAGASRGLGPC